MHTWIFTRYFCYLYFPHLVPNDIIPKGCYHLTGTFTTFLKFLIIVCVSMVLCGPHHGVQYCSFFLPTWQGHVLCILSLIKSVTEKNIFFCIILYSFVQLGLILGILLTWFWFSQCYEVTTRICPFGRSREWR